MYPPRQEIWNWMVSAGRQLPPLNVAGMSTAVAAWIRCNCTCICGLTLCSGWIDTARGTLLPAFTLPDYAFRHLAIHPDHGLPSWFPTLSIQPITLAKLLDSLPGEDEVLSSIAIVLIAFWLPHHFFCSFISLFPFTSDVLICTGNRRSFEPSHDHG